MGEARRRREHLAALLNTTAPGNPRELHPREAARLLAEGTHVVVIADHGDPDAHRLLGMIAAALGEDMGFFVITPRYAPDERPSVSLYAPSAPARLYPPLLVTFFPDSRANRALFDALARAMGAPTGSLVTPHPERGPIVFLADEISPGAILTINTLQDLHRGDADDLSLN